jgi:hypothetical protein
MSLWHVYAILGQDPGEVRLQGLGGGRVQAVRGGAVWALASERGSAVTAADPIEHHRVIEGALEQWPLLPARFAAPVTLETLVQRLERDALIHIAALERVRDAREFAIRAELEDVPPTAATPPEAPTTGRAYLQSRRQELLANETANAKLLAFSDQLCARLAPFALEFTHRYPQPGLYRGVALVPQAGLDAFGHAFAETLAAMPCAGVRPSLHGPYPPYSFTEPRCTGGTA